MTLTVVWVLTMHLAISGVDVLTASKLVYVDYDKCQGMLAAYSYKPDPAANPSLTIYATCDSVEMQK